MLTPKEVVEKLIEAWNVHDIDTSRALIDPEFVYSTPGMMNQGIKSIGKDAMLNQVWMMCYRAFPDCHIHTTNIIAEGDEVVLEEIETGTMKNPMEMPDGSIPATNRAYKVPYAFFFKVNAKGLITSMRVYTDTWQFMTQLGIHPEVLYPKQKPIAP